MVRLEVIMLIIWTVRALFKFAATSIYHSIFCTRHPTLRSVAEVPKNVLMLNVYECMSSMSVNILFLFISFPFSTNKVDMIYHWTQSHWQQLWFTQLWECLLCRCTFTYAEFLVLICTILFLPFKTVVTTTKRLKTVSCVALQLFTFVHFCAKCFNYVEAFF